MTKLRIYLAGPLSGWREKATKSLDDAFDVYDPVKKSRQRCQAEYAPDDLEATKNCQVILAYQPKNKDPCLALAIEATFGFCNGAIVVYVDERGAPDPIFIGISKRFFSNLDNALSFLNKFAENPEAQGIEKKVR